MSDHEADAGGLSPQDRARLEELDHSIQVNISVGMQQGNGAGAALASLRLDKLKKERVKLLRHAGLDPSNSGDSL